MAANLKRQSLRLRRCADRRNQAEVDACLNSKDEKWAQGRRDAEPLPASLREKLMRAREELSAVWLRADC